MNDRRVMHRGLLGRADLIDLIPDDVESAVGIAEAFGFELTPIKPDSATTQPIANQTSDQNSQPTLTEPQQNGWTTFEPAPTQYWRVTGFHRKLSEKSATADDEAISKQTTMVRSPAEVVKAAAFNSDSVLPYRPLAARNYLLTRLRSIAPIRLSASQLDVPKAIDRISRGQLLTVVPRRQRRAWGENICVIQDRSRRLVPYWFDEDQVVQIIMDLYPESSVDVARLHEGYDVPEYCFPASRVGCDWEPPSPGTLVLALTDLGMLAQSDRPEHERIWLRLGDQFAENCNPTIALVPLHANAVSGPLQQRWPLIHWQQTTQHSASDATEEKLKLLLHLIAPCIRLEPQLLREIRLLTRELRSNPELESFVWQHSIVDSQHSVAGVINGPIRESLLAHFAALEPERRSQVLETIFSARQDSHPAVHFEEVMSLDEDSRNLVRRELVKLAEDYFCALAELGDDELTTATAAWIGRCDRRLPSSYELPKRFQQAMLKLAIKTAPRDVLPVRNWMVASIPTATAAKGEIHIAQQGGKCVLSMRAVEAESAQHENVNPSNVVGSLIGTIRCSEPVAWIHEREPLFDVFAEKEFWTGGKKPTWVHRFGTDDYGAWCSFRVKDVEQILRWVPAGSFLMGSPDDEEGRTEDEGPQHRVKISRGFWMFETPCTQALWFAVMGTDPSQFNGLQRPVENVSWDAAQEFNKSLNSFLPGVGVQLPTEAQWEYACRGPGSDPERQRARYIALDEIAWYSGNSGSNTHDDRQKQCNGYGLYDTLGNFWEWCQDDNYRQYDNAAKIDPLQAAANPSLTGLVRAAYRNAKHPVVRHGLLGFRCLSSPEPGAEPSREAAMSGSESQQGGSPRDRESEWPPRGKNFPGERQGVSPPRLQFSVLSQPHSPGASTPSRMLTLNGPARSASISLPTKQALQIETDCEILSLELAAAPEWAVASGRDQYGLWAEFEINGVRQRMRWIPPGQFRMGSADKREYSYIDEPLQHTVTITHGFWMFDTPCPQQLWEAVGLPKTSRFDGSQRPVESVDFEAVGNFILTLNGKIAGLSLRLPTEAEWEYSCRAGSTSDRYGPLEEIAWYDKNSGYRTHDVKQKRANAWGLHDMLGNVWEWCLDGQREYKKGSVIDPVGAVLSFRVVRGGSWRASARRVRAANRLAYYPGVRIGNLGFRCLSSPSKE